MATSWKELPVHLPPTLLCTVGTSLFSSNLSRLDPKTQYREETEKPDASDQADRKALERYGLQENKEKLRQILEDVGKHYGNRDWPHLAKSLLLLPPELRLCGAEINSVYAMFKKGFLPENRERIVLLVSDTSEGSSIGEVLKHYFTAKNSEIRFDACETIVIAGLQDAKPLTFQREGLPNLIRTLGDQLRKWNPSGIAINATGGYKAQIAFAVAFGQATQSAVYYKHERFDQIIPFPRVPFTIDLSLVEKYLHVWANLAEPGTSFSREDLANLLPQDRNDREMMLPLLYSISEGEEALYSLSALGQIYWEAFLTRNPDVRLKPKVARTRRGCHFRDDHYPIGFKEYVRKVYDQNDFISECHSTTYSGQEGINCNEFYIREVKILGHYVDRNNFGARFEVMTTATNELERKGAVHLLNEWLGSSKKP